MLSSLIENINFFFQDTGHATFFGDEALRSIGAVRPYYPNHKGSWAFIGYKGEKEVKWIQQMSKAKGRGPSKVSASIPMKDKLPDKTSVEIRSKILIKD